MATVGVKGLEVHCSQS